MSDSVSTFSSALAGAISDIRVVWKTRESVDVHEFMLDVVGFRNFDLFDSLTLLLERRQVAVAEFLLRPLFEGAVLIAWCLRDTSTPNPRILRFRRTCFEETLELVDSRFVRRDAKYVAHLRTSITWFVQNKIKRLPPVKQMFEEIDLFRKESTNDLWRFLSRLIHGRFENWHDFARPSGETGTLEADSDDSRRVNECRALAGYLALKTIELLGQFDPVLSHPTLGQIEALWSATYRELANLSA